MSRRSTTRTPLEQRRQARERRRNMEGVLLSFPWKGPGGTPGEIRVMVVEYARRHALHIRHWERSPSGDWVATPRGVTLPRNKIAAVCDALERAERILIEAEDERSLADVLEDDGGDLDGPG